MTRSSLEDILDLFDQFGVEYIIVGGQAETIFGSPRLTYDVDLAYRRTPENLDRLAQALRELKPALRNAPPDLPFRIDSQSLALGENFTFSTVHGDLDLLGYLEPIGGFEELSRNVERHEVGGRIRAVISIDDLIRIKKHIQRPKDHQSLLQLQAIKRIRDEEGSI